MKTSEISFGTFGTLSMIFVFYNNDEALNSKYLGFLTLQRQLEDA